MWNQYRETYGYGDYTGVREFDDSEPGAIKVKYENGTIYRFSDPRHVPRMKQLAKMKNGLNDYIKQNKPQGEQVPY